GRTRSVVVGRVKIERRPLLLVEAEVDDRRYSTIVQNAETVRFVTVDGGSLGVSDLRVGSEVLLRVEEGGRHFGMPIRETISEQLHDQGRGGDLGRERRGSRASSSNRLRERRRSRRAPARRHRRLEV